MTKTSTFPIDAARAKTAARSVQNRLTTLGHDISLNHAYEAVAAVAGFPTWAVMKPTLDGGPMGPANGMPQPWHPFRIDDGNPAALVYGPADARRASVVASLLADTLGGNGVPQSIQVMCLGPVCPHLLTSLRSTAAVDQPDAVVATFGPSCRTVLNIFDLPLGRTMPTDEHKRRIVDFLETLTLGDNGVHQVAFLHDVVDKAYETALGRGRLSTKFPYERGVLVDVDACIDRMGISDDEMPSSWHGVSDLLRSRGETMLATMSSSQAMPRLETLLAHRADEDFIDKYASVRISGELIVDLFARSVSGALRKLPCLRGPSNMWIGQGPRITVLGIDIKNRDAAALLRMTVENAFKLATETADGGGNHTTPLLIYGNDIEEEDEAPPYGLVSGAIKRSQPIIVASGSKRLLDGVYRYVSSAFVTGIEKRTQVGPLCSALGLDEDAAETMHSKLFGDGRQDGTFPVFALMKRWIGTKTAVVEFTKFPGPSSKDL